MIIKIIESNSFASNNFAIIEDIKELLMIIRINIDKVMFIMEMVSKWDHSDFVNLFSFKEFIIITIAFNKVNIIDLLFVVKVIIINFVIMVLLLTIINRLII